MAFSRLKEGFDSPMRYQTHFNKSLCSTHKGEQG